MKNVVTPGTARKLKEAGFPQPEPEFGQIWYDAASNPVIMGECDSITGLVRGLNNGMLYGGKASEIIVFAPTATDILRELEYSCGLLPASDGLWLCMETDTENLFYHSNPAEAAAMAWFEQNAK